MLAAKNCVKFYSQNKEEVKVLNGLNMNVQRGSIYCLMGSSGIGKTTLLTCILNMTQLDKGEIKVAISFPNIGYMPQSLNLSSNLTIKEMLEFYAKIFSADPKLYKNRILMLDELLELPSCDQMIGNCSGGEKRRISLAAALIHNPELVILDEPTVGLDHFLRLKIWNFFRQQVEDFKITIILSTHYTNEASIGDRIGIIQDGKMICEASPHEIVELCQKDSLDDAIFDLYNSKIEHKIEHEEVVEEEKIKKKTLKMRQVGALIEKDFIVQRRNLGISIFLILFAPAGLIFFLLIFGEIPHNQKIVVPTEESLNCLIPNENLIFNIPCLYLNELKNMPYYQLVYESDKKNVFAVLTFDDLSLLSCEESFEALDIFEMKKPFLVVEFIEKSYLNDVFKQIFLIAYQKMTSKIFNECGFEINQQTLKVTGAKEQEIEMRLILTMIPFFFKEISSNSSDGTWNHVILSGVSSGEIFLSSLIAQLPILIAITIGIKITECISFEWKLFEGDLIMILMIVIAVLLGFLMATVLETTVGLMSFCYTFATLCVIFCGFYSTIEAIPWFIRPISYVLPVTLPGIAAFDCQSNLMKCEKSFYDAMIVLFSWIFVLLIFLLISLRMRTFKFVKNIN